MAARGTRRIVAVDSLLSNCVILRGCSAAAAVPARRAAELLACLNEGAGLRGYITESYAGTYFTGENCQRMDGARERIAELAGSGAISAAEHDYLLASFLLAADRVANTLGQYDAYLKNIHAESVVEGRHLRDERVRTPFLLRPLAPVACPSLTVLCDDMLCRCPAGDGRRRVLRPALQRQAVLRQLPRPGEHRAVGEARALGQDPQVRQGGPSQSLQPEGRGCRRPGTPCPRHAGQPLLSLVQLRGNPRCRFDPLDPRPRQGTCGRGSSTIPCSETAPGSPVGAASRSCCST